MSDNRRMYRTSSLAIMQFYPVNPTGNPARMLTTLAVMVHILYFFMYASI